MSTRENIVIVRRESSKPRHTVITTKVGKWYRNQAQEQKDLEEYNHLVEYARIERLAREANHV